MALTVRIQLGTLVEVEVDGVAPGNEEEDEWDAHGVPGTDFISHVAENDGYNGSTADRGDEEGCSALGVATETSHCSRLALCDMVKPRIYDLRVRAKIIGKIHDSKTSTNMSMERPPQLGPTP